MPEPQDDVKELHSEEAGSDVEVNRDLFKDQDGFRIAFFLHKSIKKSFPRRNLTRDIERHGGIVLDTHIGCDTVLVDAMYQKETLQISYNTDNNPRLRKVFVEFASFVQQCIRNNLFVHRIPALKGMGGTVGGVRTPFTESDDENLCYYLARVLPERAAGGRLGLGVYKKLVEAAAVRDTHAWGARHTAESWKERYKKNAVKFDERIEDIVKLEGRSRKQLWPEDRRAGRKFLRGKHQYEPKEEPSEGEYEDERPQPSRKRRRSDYSPPPPNRRRVVQRSSDTEGKARAEEEEEEESDESERRRSDYSSPPPNRRRVVQRSSDREGKARAEKEEEESESDESERRRFAYSPPPNRWRVVQRSSDEKGKARAEEEEQEEESDKSDLLEYLFSVDEDEPGPSRSRRSLEATTVAAGDLSHHTQPNTASFYTQETIVASAPSGRSVQSKQASHFPDEAAESSSLVRSSIQVTRGAKQASPSGHEPLAVIDLTPPSRSTGHNSPVIQHSPTRTLVNPYQTQAAQPSTRPLKAARRPRAMIEAAVADAPYKNTRSRSQSVEPYTSNSPVRVSKKRGTKGKRMAMPELATVDEIRDDRQGSENLEVVDESLAPVGEILANETEVEKMLIEDEDEESDDANQVRGVSLDTDDAQTEQNLRPTQPPRQALQRHPSEILKEFQEYSVILTNRSLVPFTGRSHLSNNRPVVPARNTQEDPSRIPLIPSPSLSRNVSVAYKAAEPPRTPLARPRKNSASSTELFPVSGTRASALKKKLQQQEKRSPYNPPSGTRAAKFARSRK